jgi:3-Oxoacyl-[acyl-carrier-protein (ACP)] synthase III
MAIISAIAARDPGDYYVMGAGRALMSGYVSLTDPAAISFSALVRRLSGRRPPRERAACVIPRGRRRGKESSAAELAVTVAEELLGRATWIRRESIDAVIYCHEAPNQSIPESTAGRIQYELGLSRANPFSVSQCHNVGVMLALDLALGMLAGPEKAEHVLIVASDKLLFSSPVSVPEDLMFGDVAAAALVSRDNPAGWRIEHVEVKNGPSADAAALADFGADQIRRAFQRTSLGPRDLSLVLPGIQDAHFSRTLNAKSGFVPETKYMGAASRRSRSASPDFLIALAEIDTDSRLSDRPLLGWSAGVNGEFGCCILTRS